VLPERLRRLLGGGGGVGVRGGGVGGKGGNGGRGSILPGKQGDSINQKLNIITDVSFLSRHCPSQLGFNLLGKEEENDFKLSHPCYDVKLTLF